MNDVVADFKEDFPYHWEKLEEHKHVSPRRNFLKKSSSALMGFGIGSTVISSCRGISNTMNNDENKASVLATFGSLFVWAMGGAAASSALDDKEVRGAIVHGAEESAAIALNSSLSRDEVHSR